ncbi:hypothetical protein BH23VER1_BH23VER1_30970 [soil metagenome]
MQHVYRQVTGVEGFRAVVLTRKRENADAFPFDKKRMAILGQPRTREARRIYQRKLRRRPVQIYLSEAKEMLYAVLGFDAKVVHIYFGHVAVQLLPFVRACPRPVVVSFHGADVGVEVKARRYREAMLEVLERADLVLARSEALVADLLALGCAEGKVRLHRTGIPLDWWPFWERTIPPGGGAWQFVQACRLIEKKGVAVSLEAFAKVAEIHGAARFVVAGEGPLRESLEARAAELGLADRVEFRGFLNQEDLRTLIYHSHVFLHPSQTGADGNREGVPNSMLEAMASGLPVVATRHGGIPEAVEHGTSGFLVAEGDADHLARCALEVMEKGSLYHRVAANGRQAVVDRFERHAQSAKLEAFYREVIDGRAARRSAKANRYRAGFAIPQNP